MSCVIISSLILILPCLVHNQLPPTPSFLDCVSSVKKFFLNAPMHILFFLSFISVSHCLLPPSQVSSLPHSLSPNVLAPKMTSAAVSSAITLGNPPESAGLLGRVLYYSHQYWIDVGDPRTADYPMVSGGAWKIAAVLITYWLLVKKILPAYMADRKPYSLVNLIRFYNTCMVVFNAIFFVILLQHIDYGRRFLDFRYPDRADTSPFALNELSLAWWGYLSRYLDMLDTIFFVLRKKQNQISFLHVYHHMIVPFLGKCCCCCCCFVRN